MIGHISIEIDCLRKCLIMLHFLQLLYKLAIETIICVFVSLISFYISFSVRFIALDGDSQVRSKCGLIIKTNIKY